jgi:hypothetical protein
MNFRESESKAKIQYERKPAKGGLFASTAIEEK